MAKTGVERFRETIAFMAAHGARELSQRIDTAMTSETRREEAGVAIKMDYRIKTDSDRARQAIMLCRYMFVEKQYLGEITTWGAACFGTKQEMQSHWRHKRVSSIMAGVKAFQRLDVPLCMAAVLQQIGRNPSTQDFKFFAMNRTPGGIGSAAAICYQTVTLAMFLAGHVSIPWLAGWYSASNAKNCFDLMGDGVEVASIDNVLNLRGTIISFRNRTRMGDQYVNHWAVVIGNGRAIGSNTDGFGAAGTNDGHPEFIWGNRNFQEFDLRECYQACATNTKYRDAGGVRIATHDPRRMDLW